MSKDIDVLSFNRRLDAVANPEEEEKRNSVLFNEVEFA
jgi:hypothetical protein